MKTHHGHDRDGGDHDGGCGWRVQAEAFRASDRDNDAQLTTAELLMVRTTSMFTLDSHSSMRQSED